MMIDKDALQSMLAAVRSTYPGWNSFMDATFLKEEIDYKTEMVERTKELLNKAEMTRLIESGDFTELLKRFDTVGKKGNLLFLSVPMQGDLKVLYQENMDKGGFCNAMFALLHGDASVEKRFKTYLDYLRDNGLPNKWPFPTYFLFLSHPETEIFIKPEAIKTFLKVVGRENLWTREPTVDAYMAIRGLGNELKEALSAYEPKDMIDIQSFIWAAKRADIHYWKIAPGENAKFWQQWKDGAYISIGWEKLGDISTLDGKTFDKKLKSILTENPDWGTVGPKQVWTFARNIREGDRIVANCGKSKVVGIGTVTGNYHFVPGVEHGHRIPVQWDDFIEREVNESGWQRTIMDLGKDKFAEILSLPPMGTNVLPVEPVGPSGPEPNPIYSLEQCAEETGFSLDELATWIQAIERKGQAVLYGPPGTGKTFVAERLAKHLIGGSDGFKDLVQFHPAYGYEDFIQGIRPRVGANNVLEYEMVPGRFLDFCEKASACQGHCVLIVDEINRANLARVFGELMYLLEYRNKAIPLAGGGQFSIPKNVYILGTMNTADRSIALVDHALRRRFAFLKLLPNLEILTSFHGGTQGINIDGLKETLRKVNSQIADFHYSVGISFFLRHDLAQSIKHIWMMEIEPYLEEFFFDQPDMVDTFRWSKVEKEILP